MEMSGQLLALGSHGIGGWVGIRTGLDAVVRRKFPAPTELESPIIQPVAQRYTTELTWLLFTEYKRLNTFLKINKSEGNQHNNS
jgi:hypothetical protein